MIQAVQKTSDPLATDQQFFDALVQRNIESLDGILADDFILIDVMSGSEFTKGALLAAFQTGQVTFESIKPAGVVARRYQSTAVITGRTEISGRVEESPFTIRSRYAHVYIEQAGRWRLVSAQGTQIAEQTG